MSCWLRSSPAALQAIGQENVDFLGHRWSLGRLSGALLYLLGFGGEIFVLTSVYLVMPVGRLSLRHALIGAVSAALLWEISRHLLVWYFATLSQVSVVYGSLTTAIAVLLSLDIAATLLLLGAQVISEYERLGKDNQDRMRKPLRPPNVQQTSSCVGRFLVFLDHRIPEPSVARILPRVRECREDSHPEQYALIQSTHNYQPTMFRSSYLPGPSGSKS